jgi:hypothetical protein
MEKCGCGGEVDGLAGNFTGRPHTFNGQWLLVSFPSTTLQQVSVSAMIIQHYKIDLVLVNLQKTILVAEPKIEK